MRRRRGRCSGKHGRVVDLLLVALMAAGMLCSAKPLLDDLNSTAKAESVISGISDRVDKTEDKTRLAALAQAQAYNLSLGGEGAHMDNVGMGGGNEEPGDILDVADRVAGEPIAPYDEQLCDERMAAMCWIEIPKIAVREPIYHGTSDATLSMGVGHISWSSLPVGGSSSHCVLAAHSAMEKARMFDQLDEIVEGDVFTLHVLGDAYSYQVTSTEVVLPKDAPDACRIEEGQDLCTLVTCTPYAINSHRLLVHARRVPYQAAPAQPSRQLRAVATSRHARPLHRLIAITSVGVAASLLIRATKRIGAGLRRRRERAHG